MTLALILKLIRHGRMAMTEHFVKQAFESLLPALGAVTIIFLVYLVYVVPNQILRESATVGLPVPSVLIPPSDICRLNPLFCAANTRSQSSPTTPHVAASPKTPAVRWETVPVDTGRENERDAARPLTTVRISTDGSWSDAKFAVVCDRPCEPFEVGLIAGQVMGTNFRKGSFQGKPPNLAAFDITSPNPFPSATYLTLTVISADQNPVAVQDVRPIVPIGPIRPH